MVDVAAVRRLAAERAHPKKPRVPRLDILAVRYAPEEKETLLELDPAKVFTADHYRGYPAILVRLGEVDEAEMARLLATAHACATGASRARRRRS